MSPLVCCILPYHTPEFVERARQCFQSQTYHNKILIELDTSALRCTIGKIRNMMIAGPTDLIAHWDHDDWSHPERLAWQVAYMEATGADIVGYQDMPFYDQERDEVTFYRSRDPKYALGTSLLYRRSLWEQRPFPDAPSEDTVWLRSLPAGMLKRQTSVVDGVPRMVATIHKGNTSKKPRFPKADSDMERAVRSVLFPSNVAQ